MVHRCLWMLDAETFCLLIHNTRVGVSKPRPTGWIGHAVQCQSQVLCVLVEEELSLGRITAGYHGEAVEAAGC